MVWLIRFAFLVKSNVRIREVGSELILGEEGEGAGLVGGSGERRFGRVLFGLCAGALGRYRYSGRCQHLGINPRALDRAAVSFSLPLGTVRCSKLHK